MSAGQLKYTLVVRHPETTIPTALLAGQPVPKWAKDLVHADDLEATTAASDDGGDTGYGSLTVKALKEEVEKRNADREDDAKVSPESDKKADLVAALEADDAASA